MSIAAKCDLCGNFIEAGVVHLAVAPCATSRPALMLEDVKRFPFDYCGACLRERPAEVLQQICRSVSIVL